MRRAIAISIVMAGLCRTAGATPYETFVDVDDQADLEDLLAAGDITQDTFDELLDLLQNGVDLNTAGRAELYSLPNLTYEDVDAIIAYRDSQKGVIRDPAALVAANAISEEKLLAIAAFISTSSPADRRGIKGYLRTQLRWSPRDHGIPPIALRGRFSQGRHIQAGFGAVLTRLEPGSPVYDPNRDALIAEGPSYKAHIPKVFLKYENDEATLIGGTYRAGFGQRLVFDNTNHYTPNGLYADDQIFYSSDLVSECRESAGELATSPCTGAAGDIYVTPDWRWRDGLLGVGAGLKKIDLPNGWLQAFVWGSATRRGIYQYELVDRGKCKDPHDDMDPNCAAPTVFVDPGGTNPLAPTARFSFETLPEVFQERLAGFNAAYYADRRNSVGVTAYVADSVNLVKGIDLDTQEWSRTPTGHTYGAAGANFSVGKHGLDVFGEAAFSFDNIPNGPGPQTGGGGPAAILRVTATRSKREELEATLRYYSTDYVNPYARPIAQPDEFDGQRARDEMGVRFRYYKTDKRVGLRALLDLWVPPSTLVDDPVNNPLGAIPKLDTYLRTDFRTTDQLRLGLWVRFQDKDLRRGGHDQCFEVPTDTNENGEPVPCGGRQLTTIGRARYAMDRKTAFELRLEHQFVDDPSDSMTSFRQDVAAYLIAHYVPTPKVRLRFRARYLDEAIDNNDYLERSLSTLLDGAFILRAKDALRVRIDTKFWLDNRASTMTRDPNPELQVWLSYDAKL